MKLKIGDKIIIREDANLQEIDIDPLDAGKSAIIIEVFEHPLLGWEKRTKSGERVYFIRTFEDMNWYVRDRDIVPINKKMIYQISLNELFCPEE